MNFNTVVDALAGLTEANRPIRVRLPQGPQQLSDVLLVKRVTGSENLCGGLEYRLLCVSARADLPLKAFIAVPAELQFVTDRGDMRVVCGIVAQAAAGQSDGGLATYELVVRDALALMESRTNTRVFRNLNELEISQVILDEWRKNNLVLAKTFDVDWSHVSGIYPAREFTMQHNESDADFLRRLWKRRGIAWFIRPGKASEPQSQDMPMHVRRSFGEVVWEISKNCADASGWRDWPILSDNRQGKLELVRWNWEHPDKAFAPRVGAAVPESIYAKLLPPAAPGDQTVPARSADHQLQSGVFKGVFRQLGYEHQSSYKDSRAIASTLYSIVRIAQKARWSC